MANENATQARPPFGETPERPEMTPEMMKQVVGLRDRLHGAIGVSVLSMSAQSRYRHLSLADLQAVLLDPLLRDRVAIASTPLEAGEGAPEAQVGLAIWASVSSAVDEKIREQIAARVFPVRLAPDDWVSGEINWLFDVIAPDERLTSTVIANLRKVVKEGDLRVHPMVAAQLSSETLEKLGISRAEKSS